MAFRRQAISSTNADLRSIGLLGNTFSDFLIKIHKFWQEMHLEI